MAEKFARFESDSGGDSDEDPIPVDDNGRKGYHLLAAAERNDITVITSILSDSENSDLVNYRDRDGYMPLHRASHNNHVESMKLLLSKGAAIDGRTADGWQPLHCAVRWNMLDAVDVLMKNGADVNARTAGNVTPLHLAANLVHSKEVLVMLLSHPDIDVTIVNGAGETARDIAYRTSENFKLFTNERTND